MKRLLRRLVIILGASCVLFGALSWFFAYKLTGPRQRIVGPAPADFPFPIQNITFSSADGENLQGWLVPAESDRAIVLLHGYGGDRRQMLGRARFWREQGYTVLLYDARACGESTGTMITFGCRESEDLVAALALLRDQGKKRIGCLGVSQGGATILLAADRLDGVDWVICESAYDAIAHAVDNRCRHYLRLPCWCVGCLLVPLAEYRIGISTAQIQPIDHIGNLTCPLLLISGDQDTKTLPADTLRLYAAANEPKQLWMVPGAGHRDLATQDGYWEKILTFVAGARR